MHAGVAFKFVDGDIGEGIPVPLLNADYAFVFNTSDTPSERETEIFGDPLNIIWHNCILSYCGVKEIHRKMFNVVVTSSETERKEWLEEVLHTLKNNIK